MVLATQKEGKQATCEIGTGIFADTRCYGMRSDCVSNNPTRLCPKGRQNLLVYLNPVRCLRSQHQHARSVTPQLLQGEVCSAASPSCLGGQCDGNTKKRYFSSRLLALFLLFNAQLRPLHVPP